MKGLLLLVLLAISTSSNAQDDSPPASSQTSAIVVEQPSQPSASTASSSSNQDNKKSQQSQATQPDRPDNTAASVATGAKAVEVTHKVAAIVIKGAGSLGDADVAAGAATTLGGASTAAGGVADAANVVDAYQKGGRSGAAVATSQILVEKAGGQLVKALATTAAAALELPAAPVVAAGSAGFALGTAVRDHTAAGRWVQDREFDLVDPKDGAVVNLSDRLNRSFVDSGVDLSKQSKPIGAGFEQSAGASGKHGGPLGSLDREKLTADIARTNQAEAQRIAEAARSVAEAAKEQEKAKIREQAVDDDIATRKIMRDVKAKSDRDMREFQFESAQRAQAAAAGAYSSHSGPSSCPPNNSKYAACK
jgi:hypothetical protein